ncbi:hypothetical protein QYE76_000629 [Lolium multiflorum]|uniref:F-box domain-containing protein n=1 Tax=Lolium multiflorum TaxID=4521 RepID=A0AAD8VXU5_LOLMU|nr:hypothetical protein QYE76_000629 [Lolium multiflorum]
MAGDEGQLLKSPDATAAHGDGREEMEEELQDQAARLPDDVLAGILRRVPPRWVAASRCVCRAWRDAVDGRRLLRADLLPLSFAGLFVHFDEHKFPEFLARPSSSAAAVSGNLSFLPSASPDCGYYWQQSQGCDWKNYNIKDHCNGLLLLHNNCVVNPATHQWNILPKGPAKRGAGNVRYRSRLVYDPTVSPYYKVVKIPTLAYYRRGEEPDPSMEESQWPPSVCKMFVYSSKSGCWEEKNFVREGDAAGTAGKIRARRSKLSAAYFRGALYLHCQTDFLMRVSLSNNTYSVIEPPMGRNAEDYLQIKIAKSGNGLYFVALDTSSRRDRDICRLRVWILNESCGQMVWMLKHDKDLKQMPCHQLFRTPVKWVLEDINCSMFRDSEFQQDNNKETTEEKFDWSSDGDIEDKNMVHHGYSLEDMRDLFYDIELLGFHPNEEIVFLTASKQTCLAYHLNGSKIEELGNMYPKDYYWFKELANEMEHIKSFIYTPCWMQEFPGSN